MNYARTYTTSMVQMLQTCSRLATAFFFLGVRELLFIYLFIYFDVYRWQLTTRRDDPGFSRCYSDKATQIKTPVARTIKIRRRVALFVGVPIRFCACTFFFTFLFFLAFFLSPHQCVIGGCRIVSTGSGRLFYF